MEALATSSAATDWLIMSRSVEDPGGSQMTRTQSMCDGPDHGQMPPEDQLLGGREMTSSGKTQDKPAWPPHLSGILFIAQAI